MSIHLKPFPLCALPEPIYLLATRSGNLLGYCPETSGTMALALFAKEISKHVRVKTWWETIPTNLYSCYFGGNPPELIDGQAVLIPNNWLRCGRMKTKWDWGDDPGQSRIFKMATGEISPKSPAFISNLLGRMIFCERDESYQSTRQHDLLIEDSEAVRGYIAQALYVAGCSDGVVSMSENAKELLIDHYNQWETLKLPFNKKHLRRFIAHTHNNTCRIATVLHASEQGVSGEISEEEMAGAIRLSNYYMENTFSIFGDAGWAAIYIS